MHTMAVPASFHCQVFRAGAVNISQLACTADAWFIVTTNGHNTV